MKPGFFTDYTRNFMLDLLPKFPGYSLFSPPLGLSVLWN